MLSTITPTQIIVLCLCLAATFAAHRWLGLDPGIATGFVATIITFLLGRPPVPPNAK